MPRPIAASDNAILMSYHGDERMAAPTLNTIHLEPDEARRLYLEVLRNVDLMLQRDLIHGDLSAYNILYWAAEDTPGDITIIDFPQVVNLRTNDKARFILRRDIQRTCEYFGQQGVQCDAVATMEGLWRRYVEGTDPLDLAADWSRLVKGFDSLIDEAEAVPIPINQYLSTNTEDGNAYHRTNRSID